MRRALAGLFVAVVLVLVTAFVMACHGDPFDPLSVPAPYREVAEIHHAKCGACHTRVEPGMRTRQKLEKALVKHRSRVTLSEANWALLIDYLSQTPPPH
jgi:hypothetical protein